MTLANDFTVEGRLYDNNNQGAPLASSTVYLTLEVVVPGSPDCVLYAETLLPKDLSSPTDPTAVGVFAVRLGSGTMTIPPSGSQPEMTSLFNSGSVLPGYTEALVPCTVNPAPTDHRVVRIKVKTAPGDAWDTLSPDTTVTAVPQAMIADSANSLQGKMATDFLQVDNNALTQPNVAFIFSPTNFPLLKNVLAGTSNLYLSSAPSAPVSFNGQAITNVANPTGAQDVATKHYVDSELGGQLLTVAAPAAGQAVVWNGSSWTNQAVMNLIVAGTGLTGGNITSSGTINVDVGTTPGKIVQLDPLTGKLPAVDGSLLTNVTPTIGGHSVSTAAPTPAQLLAYNNLTSQWEPTSLSVNGKSGTNITLNGADLGLGSASALSATPLAGSVVIYNTTSGLGLPAADGSQLTNLNASNLLTKPLPAVPTIAQNAQSLRWNNGTGAWEYFTPATGTVSSVTVGGLPLSVVNSTSTPQISIAQASSTVDGYLLHTDWSTFNSKLDSTAASSANTINKIVLRDGSGNFAAGVVTTTEVLASSSIGIGTTVPGAALDVQPVLNSSSATDYGVKISPVVSASGTEGFTSLLVNTTEAATGSGGRLLLDLQVGGLSKFSVDDTGTIHGNGSALTGIGGTISGLTSGRVTLSTSTSTVGDSANLTFSSSTGILSVGGSTPAVVQPTGSTLALGNTSSTSAAVLSSGTGGTTVNSTATNASAIYINATGVGGGISLQPGSGGAVGVNTSPTVSGPALQVNGETKVGNSAATCVAAFAGAIRYSSNTLQFCNGTNWTQVASSGDSIVSGLSISGGANVSGGLTIGGGVLNMGVQNIANVGGSILGNGNLTIAAGTGGKLSLGNATTTAVLMNSNVGIGTTAPNATLDVEGGTQTSSMPALQVAQIWNNSTVFFDAPIFEKITDLASQPNSLLIDLGVNGSSKFTVDKTGALYLSSSVNIGTGQVVVGGADSTIYAATGASAFPGTPAVAASNGTFGDNTISSIVLAGGNSASTTQTGYIGIVAYPSGHSPSLVFGAQNGASSYAERMRIDPNGNLGIGTTLPNALLNVHGGAIVSDTHSNSSGISNIDFTSGNVQTSANTTGNAPFKICGLQDGGSYTLILTAQPVGSTPSFTAYSDSSCTVPITNFDAGGVALTTTSATTLLNFVRGGPTVYAVIATGFTH